MQSSDKFSAEAKAIMTNFKIAIQRFKDDPNTSENLDVLHELSGQLSSTASVYGINSLMKLTDLVRTLFSTLINDKKSADKDTFNFITGLETLLQGIIDDPLLNDPNLKKAYSEAEKRLEDIGSGESDPGSKMVNARFQEVFVEEAYDLINQLEEKMLQLESDMSDEELIDSVFRIMHTLKGNSNMFGFVHLGEITHQLENIYDGIRGKKIGLSRQILEITLECIDHFRNLIEDADLSNSDNKEQQQYILTEIGDILSGNGDESEGKTKHDHTKKNSSSGKLHTFYLFFRPEANIFDDGTNPMYFVYDLHEMGQCFPLAVFDDDMESGTYDPEKCHTMWHILLATEGTEEEIGEHFMFLREKSQPQIKTLAASNLIENNNFMEYFKEEAKKKTFLGHLEADIFVAQIKAERQAKNEDDSKSTNNSIASVRVASTKIDKMMNLISELVTKQAELSILANGQHDQRLIEVAESIENISRDLRDNAFTISLISLEKSVLRFQRLVRDVSSRFSKQVELVVEGKETELDKTVIEKIIDPIMHILRNSIDHGIEMPDERIRKGKSEAGIIKLNAYPSGANVVIEISDDGAGINLEKVRLTAIKKGYIGPNDNPSKEELLDMIISPGFSTAENISEVSGRGVGMDVVKQKISEIRGEFEIKTEKDVGTTITIRLPLTISIIDSLLTKIAGEYYLVPLAVVERCAEVHAKDIEGKANKYITLNTEYIPYVDLRNEFGIDGERPDIQQVVLVRFKEVQVGIIVDEVVGNYQAVLKSLGEAYKRQEIISGASILGSGEVALVLDTNKIVQEYSSQNELRVNAMA